MRTFVLSFALGVAWLQQHAELPPLSTFAALGSVAALLLLLQKSALAGRRGLASAAIVLAAILLGWSWAGWRAQLRLAHSLPAALEGRDIDIVGRIASLPQRGSRGLRFEIDVERAPDGVPERLMLSWFLPGYSPDELEESLPLLSPMHVGEQWRFTVRLKRAHGAINPAGYDYESRLFERNLRATGYVRAHSARRLQAASWRSGYWVERTREALRARFLAALPQAEYVGVLIALAIGDQQAIDAELWRSFARTGISHLMSISGLHVTMLAGLGYALTNWLWRRSARLPLYLPAQQAAALAGAATALLYALLAGFGVPAQRTLYMLAVVAWAQWSRRNLAASQVLACALGGVLLIDPWAVLAAGFWLSFGAVALLFFIGSGRLAALSWWREWGRTQWAVSLGTIPALLALFQQFSLVSPLANAVAIPLVSFVITPLSLAGMLPGLEPLWSLAHFLTQGLMWAIDGLAAWPGAVWQQAKAPWPTVLLAGCGSLWLLLPRGVPARWLGALTFLPMLTWQAPRPAVGAAKVVVLDVGEGLAVHVQTANRDLLFDAGPAFSASADSGNRIIAPYLTAIGVQRLDAMVISHADRDHTGGAASVLAALPVAQLKTSLPFDHPLSAYAVAHRPCVDGEVWSWDEVRFEFLHPPPEATIKKPNEQSCVLRIVVAGRSLLLAADIEVGSERALLQRHRAELAADVISVPHQGSRSSSTPDFVRAVGAREAIISAGYRNSFRHPHPEIVARYTQSGATVHRTDSDGAVTVELTAAGISVTRQREVYRRYWHGGG